MPTVLRLNGFRIAIYQGDREHGPAHVHVVKAGGVVVVNLTPVSVRRIDAMNRSCVRAAVRLVEDNHATLLDLWRAING